MIAKSRTTKILILTLALALVVLAMVVATGFTTAKADSASVEADSGEVITAPVEEESGECGGNWFSENWKAIVEIFTSSTAVAVIFAIIKVFAKIRTLRGDLGSTNLDNKAIKEAFNNMVDEVESFRKELEAVHNMSELLKSAVNTSADKTTAVLSIFEKLISASDLPSEVKLAMQSVINKAGVSGNDEA